MAVFTTTEASLYMPYVLADAGQAETELPSFRKVNQATSTAFHITYWTLARARNTI